MSIYIGVAVGLHLLFFLLGGSDYLVAGGGGGGGGLALLQLQVCGTYLP